jgi:hypothetical protein
MVSARVPAMIALALALATAGCDLVFAPGKLDVDASPGDDAAAAPDASSTVDLCGPDPGMFDPRRFAQAWTQTDMMPWLTASATCEGRGWQLATIDTVAEADAIGSFFGGTDHWIGLHDPGDETWMSPYGCPDPGAWDVGQPDIDTENCAGLDGSSFRLHAFPCAGSASSPDTMICEQPKPPTVDCARDAARPFAMTDYIVLGSMMSYTAARGACSAMGMHPVMIDTPDESASVAVLSGGIDYWVGATDANQEAHWLTETGCPGYLQWNINEPSNGGGTGDEDCASGIGAGMINDVDCTMAKEVICEVQTPR